MVGLVAVLVVANIALAASIWLKKDETAKPQEQRGDARDYLIKSLALTKAQIKSFDSLRKSHFERMRRYREQMRQAKDALFAQLKQPPHSEADGLAKRIGELQATMDLETFEHFSSLRSVLTLQQAQTFDNTIQEVLRTMAPGGQRPPRPGEGMPGGNDRMGPPPGEGFDGPPPPEGERPPHS